MPKLDWDEIPDRTEPSGDWKGIECEYRTTKEVFTDIPSPHYGKIVCADCGQFQTWIAKPDRDKAKRESAHRDLVEKFGDGYCELCLRKEQDLPRGENLVGHHRLKYTDGGPANRENIWVVCSFCHAVIECIRTYLGHYKKKDQGSE